MSFKVDRQAPLDAELDITSFMNLMVILVPVLLLSLTFTHVTVLELDLPDPGGGQYRGDQSQSQLEVVMRSNGMAVYFPAGVLVKEIPLLKGQAGAAHDYDMLSRVMKRLKENLPDKRDILIRSDGDINYQSLVSTMDVVKSYKTVVTASLVEVELFPEISLGDAR